MPIVNPTNGSTSILELIENRTFTAQANVDFALDGLIDFTVIIAEIVSLIPATNDVQIGAQISTGGVFAASNYINSGPITPLTGQAASALGGTNRFQFTGTAANYRASNGSHLTGEFKLYGPYRTSLLKRAIWQTNFTSQNGTFGNINVNGGGRCDQFTTAVDGIRFAADSGNISGQIALYGIRGNA